MKMSTNSKQKEFQYPEVEQPNNDGIQIADSKERKNMKKSRRLWTDKLMDSTAEVEDMVVEKIEKTEVLAPKIQEFQSPEVEQPNDDRIQMPDSIEGGAQGWVAWLTDDPLGLAGVHEEDRCRLVGGLIAIGIIIILMIVILCMSFKLLGFESYLF